MSPQNNVEKFSVCCQFPRAMTKLIGLSLSVTFGKHTLVEVRSYTEERSLGSSAFQPEGLGSEEGKKNTPASGLSS